MNELLNSLTHALKLIISLDKEVIQVAFTSFRIASISLFIACMIGIPAGIFISIYNFRFKKLFIGILSSMLAMPTVVIGLFVYSFISRSGPFGEYRLLFTPAAIIIGQVILVFPIIISFVINGISKLDPRFLETMITLGGSKIDILKGVLIEARFILLTSVLAGFGRIIGEVGVSMILGGNIKGFTRTITTAIALESSRGEFVIALALGIILMSIAVILNLAVILIFGSPNRGEI